MVVTDYHLDARQASVHEIAQELVPTGSVFGGGDIGTQDLTMPLSVDPNRHQAGHVDDAASLTDLDRQSIDPHVRVGAAVEWPASELVDHHIQVGSEGRYLRLGQRRDPQRLGQPFHPPRRDTPHIGFSYHRNERSLSPGTSIQEPVREVRPLPQLRDTKVNAPHPRVPAPRPIPVPTIHPIGARLSVRGTAHRVSISRHQRFSKRRHHLAQQIRVSVLELLAQPRQHVHAHIDHRVSSRCC